MSVRRKNGARRVSNNGRCASNLVTDAVKHSALDTRHWRLHPVRRSSMDRGTLGEVGVDLHGLARLLALAVCNDELGFLLEAAIVAPPPHGNPRWMLVDPLCDVGLRIHDALIERHVSRELKMLIFAVTRQRQYTHGYDQFDQAHRQFSVGKNAYEYLI